MAEPPASILDRVHITVTVGSVALITLMAYQSLAVTTAMPAVVEAIGGLDLYALAFGAPLATALVGMAVSGGWNDARGPAYPLTAGATLFATGLIVAGSATSMGAVALGRGVQGFGSGIVLVALYIVVARFYPESLRPQVFASFAAAWVLPALIGPAISGMIVEHIGWRWVFLSMAVVVPFAVLAIQPGLRKIHDDDRGAPLRPAILTGRVGWAAAAGGAACLLHLPGQTAAATTVLLLTVGVAGIAVAAPRLLPRGTFRAGPGLPSTVALRGLASAAFLGAEIFIPLLLVRERGLSPAAAGLTLTAAALTWSLGSWLQGRGVLPDRRMRLRIGMTLVAAGVAATAALVADVVPVALGIGTWALAGLGMGLVYPTLSVLVFEQSSRADQGRNTSSMQIADALFSTVMLALAGTAFAALITVSTTWPYLAGFALAASVAAAGIVVAGRVLPRVQHGTR